MKTKIKEQEINPVITKENVELVKEVDNLEDYLESLQLTNEFKPINMEDLEDE